MLKMDAARANVARAMAVTVATAASITIKRQQTQAEAALAGTHQPEHGWQCPCCTHVRQELGAET